MHLVMILQIIKTDSSWSVQYFGIIRRVLRWWLRFWPGWTGWPLGEIYQAGNLDYSDQRWIRNMWIRWCYHLFWRHQPIDLLESPYHLHRSFLTLPYIKQPRSRIRCQLISRKLIRLILLKTKCSSLCLSKRIH